MHRISFRRYSDKEGREGGLLTSGTRCALRCISRIELAKMSQLVKSLSLGTYIVGTAYRKEPG